MRYSLQQAKNAARIVAASELAHAAELLMKSGSDTVRNAGAMISLRIGPLLRLETEPYCDELDDFQPFLDLEAEFEKRETVAHDSSTPDNA